MTSREENFRRIIQLIIQERIDHEDVSEYLRSGHEDINKWLEEKYA